MSTKFINGQDFGKIESIKTAKKHNAFNKFNKKLLRFAKRLKKELSKDVAHISKKFKDITWSTLTPAKFFGGIRKICFPKSMFKQLTTPRGIFNVAVPVLALGLLVFTICFWTCADYSIALSYEDRYLGSISNDSVLTEATAQVNNALAAVDDNSGTVTPKMQLTYPWSNPNNSGTAEVYEKLVDCNDGIVSNTCGVYVDGVFFGACEDYSAVTNAFTSYLSTFKSNYDSATVTSFNNSVEFKYDVYALKTLMSADELLEAAKPYLSVKLITDYVVEQDIVYDTVYKYDSALPDTYRKVTQKGVNGKEKIHYSLVYIDGVQTDAIVNNREVLADTIDEIVVVGTKKTNVGTGTFLWPVPSAHNISSLFEYRWGSFHNGIDIADVGIYRANIVASDRGVVESAGWDSSGYGYMVVINHGNGYKTLYAHCDELFVTAGQVVDKGEVIAKVGTTGFSTGYHLHFEIISNGTPVNPVNYIDWNYTVIYY